MGTRVHFGGRLLFGGLTAFLFAQTTSTEVSGLVTDPSGAPIISADVHLTRTATGETRRAASNNEGAYGFPLIEPGEYTVAVSAPGFKTTNVAKINVLYQQHAGGRNARDRRVEPARGGRR
jgi:hypothetical protein